MPRDPSSRIAGVRRLLHLPSVRHDIDDELRFHVESRVDALLAQGLDRRTAERTAWREFGDLPSARAELEAIDRRRARGIALGEWIESVRQDARVALRGLVTRPVFSLTVVFTIALGVGANAAIFSVLDAVLLRALPYAHPDRLVHLWETFHSNVANQSEASYPDYLDWRARNRVFADMGGYRGAAYVLGSQQPTVERGAQSTANFFDVLGVHAAIGRTFLPGEDDVGAPRVALLSDGLWRRAFASDRSVIGRTITVDGTSATVVGVLPAGFTFAPVRDAGIWMPIDASAEWRRERGSHWLNVVARLDPGATVASAAREMSSVMTQMGREYPGDDAARDARIAPLRDTLVGSVRPLILLLYGAVAVLLLVACVNCANLMLIRGADRRREMAVRIALGAGRARLVRQLMTESALLTAAGGALGLVVARLGLAGLLGLIPPGAVTPVLAAATINGPVLIYSIGICVVTAMLVGLVPALRESGAGPADGLKLGARGNSRAGALRDTLVVTEVALTVVLVSGAALFGRSLVKLMSIELGFNAEHLTTASIDLPNATYPDAATRVHAFDRIVSAVRALPGVDGAGLVTRLPLDWGTSTSFTIVGQPAPAPDQEPSASYRTSSPGYFAALETPLVDGRDFRTADDTTAPLVAIVNRAFGRAYFDGATAVGQRIVLHGTDSVRIVGEVGDVPIGNIDDRVPPTLYMAFAQDADNAMHIAIRSRGDAGDLPRDIARIVDQQAPGGAVVQAMPMDELLAQSSSVFMRRFPLLLVGAFALVTMVLAMVGIYGMVSYSVSQRRRELGIRLALGAQPRSLVSLVVRHGGTLAGAGILIGLTVAIVLARFIASMLYGVSPNDPAAYAAAAIVLAVVAIAAGVLPARRATRVNPATVLRSD
ncbi:MAG TPA: ABC transporter permease [Gemmatimonadaceae bacterium]|jgi:predicted permease